MKQGHAGTLEMFVGIFFLQTSLIHFNLANFMSQRVYTGGWLLNLLMGMFAISQFYLVNLLLKRYPGRSIIEIAELIAGRVGAIFIGLILGGFYMYVLTTLLTALGLAINASVLPSTPMYFMIGSLLLVAIYLAYRGIEALTRVGMIFFPFVLVGIGLIILLNFDNSEMHRLYPLPGADLSEFFMSTVRLSPIVYNGMILAIAASFIRGKKNNFGLYFWATVLSTVVLTLLLFTIQTGIFMPATQITAYPLFNVVRNIHMGRFFQRVESLYILLAVVSNTMHICWLFQLGIVSIGQSLKLTDYRPLIFSWATMAFAIASIPQNTILLARRYYSWTSSLIFYAVTALLPFVLLGIALLKGHKGGDQADA